MTTRLTLSFDHKLVLEAIDRKKLSQGRGVFKSNITDHFRLAEAIAENFRQAGTRKRNVDEVVTGALTDLVAWHHVDKYETTAGRWMYRLTLLGLEAVCNQQHSIAV